MRNMEQYIKDKILSYNQQVPRYTSYPTAPHFYELRDEQTYPNWLNAINDGEHISLYVHIPYCARMCWYCGCHTKVTKRYEPVFNYVDYLLKEIDLVAAQLMKAPKVSHLHFGGGSPTMLEANDFGRIMTHISSKFEFSDDAELAIEVDPRNITEGRVATYAKHGINRVSIGVQDFDDQVLKAVNRPQPYHVSYDAIKLFRKYDIEHINIDMLYGLPHQTIDTVKESFAKLMTLNPSRISYFGYAHVPWVKKHMRLIKEDALPNPEERLELYLLGQEILLEHGYRAIGIDHFAKSEDSIYQAYKNNTLHRNFQGYTTDNATTMIGLGVSSIGQFAQGFMQNARTVTEYKAVLDKDLLPTYKCCVTSREDQLRADVIKELMCNYRVNLSAICKAHNFAVDHFKVELVLLQDFVDAGIVDVFNDEIVVVKEEMQMLVRLICAVFDLYFDMSGITPKHSQAI